MAEPQREHRVRSPGPGPSARSSRRAAPRKSPRRRRSEQSGFVLLVVVPVLLMLGSVYLHTVSAGLGDRVAELEGLNSNTAAESDRLEIRVAELSRPGRIRPLAREELKMRDPDGSDLKVYGNNREVDRQSGGEKKRENPQ